MGTERDVFTFNLHTAAALSAKLWTDTRISHRAIFYTYWTGIWKHVCSKLCQVTNGL